MTEATSLRAVVVYESMFGNTEEIAPGGLPQALHHLRRKRTTLVDRAPAVGQSRARRAHGLVASCADRHHLEASQPYAAVSQGEQPYALTTFSAASS
jgi:hypothetical protein